MTSFGAVSLCSLVFFVVLGATGTTATTALQQSKNTRCGSASPDKACGESLKPPHGFPGGDGRVNMPKIRFAPDPTGGQVRNPPGGRLQHPQGGRVLYPWQRVKPGRERRPGGRSYNPTDRRGNGSRRVMLMKRRQLKSMKALVKAMSKFNQRLFKQIKGKTKGDFVMSPMGVHLALSMTSLGAQGTTLRELRKILGYKHHYKYRKVGPHLAYFHLRDHLSTTYKDVRLLGTFGIFVKPRIPLEMTFRQKVSQLHYGHFDTLTPTPVDDINAWASKTSGGELSTLVPTRGVKASTRMAVVSALCLKASWESPFNPGLTKVERFHSADGVIRDVVMMKKTALLRVTNRDDGRYVLHLPLSSEPGGENLVMDIVVSKNVTTSPPSLLATTSRDLNPGPPGPIPITLVLPKFQMNNHFPGLKSALKKLGLRKTFRRRKANFQGISSAPGIFLQKIFHRGAIVINEDGVGCTRPLNKTVSIPMSPRAGEDYSHTTVSVDQRHPEIKVDKPFDFMIRELAMGTVLVEGVFTGNHL